MLLWLLSITVVVILSMALLMQMGFVQGFATYQKTLEKELNDRMLSALESHYAEQQSWQDFAENPRLWHDLIFNSATEGSEPRQRKTSGKDRPPRRHKGPKGAPHRSPRNPDLQRVMPSYTLFDQQQNKIIGPAAWGDKNTYKIKIKHQNQVVGYFSHSNKARNNRAAAKQFNSTFLLLLAMVSGVMMVVAVLFTLPMAKYFTKPIAALNQATQTAAAGDYSVRTNIERSDELGQLGQNFNLLVSTLQSNAEVQKKMMADIAHELRTPVAVLLAEIEAIQDGIHQADEQNLNLLHQQISALRHLINDLHQLSVADLGSMQYQMQAMDLTTLIDATQQALQLKAKQKNLDMRLEPTATMQVLGDHNRLTQLFNNLLNNAISYTDAGGCIVIKQKTDETSKQHIITIDDSEPGLLPSEMEQMFDRLYRKESSRNKKSGGSGLGLAIAKNIVAAHNGRLTASASELGGVCMTIRIPQHV